MVCVQAMGNDKAAKIAHHAHIKHQTLKQACVELGYLSEQEFDKIVLQRR